MGKKCELWTELCKSVVMLFVFLSLVSRSMYYNKLFLHPHQLPSQHPPTPPRLLSHLQIPNADEWAAANKSRSPPEQNTATASEVAAVLHCNWDTFRRNLKFKLITFGLKFPLPFADYYFEHDATPALSSTRHLSSSQLLRWVQGTIVAISCTAQRCWWCWMGIRWVLIGRWIRWKGQKRVTPLRSWSPRNGVGDGN